MIEDYDRKCKNCKLTKEDHYAPWKVTNCKFNPVDDSQTHGDKNNENI